MNFTERLVKSVVEQIGEETFKLSAKDVSFLKGIEDKINKMFDEQKKLVRVFVELLKKAVLGSGMFINQPVWAPHSFDVEKNLKHYTRVRFNDLTYDIQRIDVLFKDLEKYEKYDELEYLELKIKKEANRILKECKKYGDEVIDFLVGFVERSGFGEKENLKIIVSDGDSQIRDNNIFVHLEFYFKQGKFGSDAYRLPIVERNKSDLLKEVKVRFETAFDDFEEERKQADV